MNCQTCALLRDVKQGHRDWRKEQKALGQPARRNYFTAAIVDRTFRGRLTFYKNGQGRRIPLNYCPECGRQIKTKRST